MAVPHAPRSAKKAAKSTKKTAAEAPAKTEADRRAETARIRAQLLDLGAPAVPPELERDLAAFDLDGVGVTRTHAVRDLGVAVTVQLSTRWGAASFARVRGLPPPVM